MKATLTPELIDAGGKILAAFNLGYEGRGKVTDLASGLALYRRCKQDHDCDNIDIGDEVSHWTKMVKKGDKFCLDELRRVGVLPKN